MAKNTRLAPEQLYQYCDSKQFDFSSTADLKTLPTIIGQTRAIDAIDFGINISGDGYNLYVMGPTGSGKYTLVKRYLEQIEKTQYEGVDWAYLHNFSDDQCPWYVSLPSGEGRQLRHDIEALIRRLVEDLPTAFDDEYYRGRIRAIDEMSRKHRVQMFGTIQAEADRKDILLLRMQDNSYAFAAKRNGEPMTSEEFEQLPLDKQEQTEDAIASLHEELQNTLLELREWERSNQQQVAALNEEVALEVISRQINKLKHAYPKSSRLQVYFDAMQIDLRDNVDTFLKLDEEHDDASTHSEESILRRYQINLIVDNKELDAAPIVYENLPSHQSLLGSIENMAMMGALVTDFSLIKAGAIHRANGGYLILDVEQLLMQPYAWQGLKRALQSKEVRFDVLEQMYSLVSTVSLEPEPIPLDLKVILLGDRELYYQLFALDPEFAELFKVIADFEEEMPRTSENEKLYAQLMATTVQQEGLLHLNSDAIASVIEYGAREVDDAAMFSLHQGNMTNLLREADYWAKKQEHRVITRSHVINAIESRINRTDRLRKQLYKQIERDVMRIEVTGEKIGQINALSVLSVGDFNFGQPSRLTANCRYGDGELIDIDREVELGGDIHSKGVLIMSSYLGSHYAKNKPLSMTASLAFEQSYGQVDGDSATVAELCVLLSSMAQTPIKQSIAITGSMNQHGMVQAIGGVNEKIEGFFDICQQLDFTGQQGVIIPSSNVQHLMLRSDVITAVSEGRFHIYAIETVEQALALLTDMPIGKVNDEGIYPEVSFNALVMEQINYWAEIHKNDKHDDN